MSVVAENPKQELFENESWLYESTGKTTYLQGSNPDIKISYSWNGGYAYFILY